jgi:ribosomal protein S18 acetylase RimI-like enzyme
VIALELSLAQLTQAVEGNLFALFRDMAQLPGGKLVERDHLNLYLTSPSNPMFKGIWGTNLAPDSMDAAIEEAVRFFSTQEAPFCFWWTRDEPSPLSERLKAHGFAEFEINAPGMAATLDKLNYGAIERVPEGFEIEQVQNPAQLEDFKQALISAFELPEWAAQAWITATLMFGIAQAPWQLYVGYLEGEPVATNILYCGGGVASVYGIATRKDLRGRGIGAAITLAGYQDALERGYRYGVLFASEAGHLVYKRIGFENCPIHISRYLWRKP